MTVRALVVGSLTMELAFEIPASPEAGEVAAATSFGALRGGAGYHQAVALARLGAQVGLVAAVGEDDHAEAFAGALAQEGVDALLLRLPATTTALEVPLATPDGSVATVLHPAANERLTADLLGQLPVCDILLVQGEVPAATSAEAARRVRAAGGTVVLDAAPAGAITDELLEAADVLVAGEAVARALVHGQATGPRALATALAGGGRTVVVTSGPAGASYAGPGGNGTAAPPPVEPVDEAGAGHAFCAALAVAIAEGQGLGEAVRFACTAGALTTTTEGAAAGFRGRADVERLVPRG